MITKVKTSDEIAAMRESGRMLATVLNVLCDQVRPGMTTQDLNELAKKTLKPLGGTPAFLGQYGFPAVLCVSLNDEVVHGLPSAKRVIRDGDIVSMDFGVTYKGMITDAATSLIAGSLADQDDQRLLEATKASLDAGIMTLRHGVKVGDIAASIQAVLDKGGYGIVRELVGHGVGHELHEEPNIPNYGRKGTGMQLSAGMTIAIEPMATRGSYKVFTDVDRWTVKTVDGSRAAHFEATVLITPDGSELLTTV